MSDTTEQGADALELLFNRLFQEVRAGERRPLRLVDDAAAELLIDAFARSILAVFRFELELEKLCQEHNITKRYYDLGPYKRRGKARAKEARDRERMSEEMQRRSGKLLNDQRQQAQRRQEQPIPPAETMMTADDPMMRIAGLLLYFREGRVWYDTFHKCVRLDWKGGKPDVVDPFTLDDATVLRIMIWAKAQDYELAGIGKQVFVDAIELVADLDHRNEVRDYLDKLVWDGTRRIDTFLVDIYHAEPTEFNCAVGANILVGLCARIFDPGCQFDNVMVLIGGQGVFKSQSLRALGGKWYRSLSASVDNADFIRGMHGAWVIELAELSSMTGTRVHAEQTKARLSMQVDSQRPLYKNFFRDLQRNSIPIGTTNDVNFHYDPTSDDARRYWPVFVCINGELIELQMLKDDRDQLLAEAVVRYRAGHAYWEVPGPAQRQIVDKVRRVNEFQDKIETWLDNQQDAGLVFDGEVRTFDSDGRALPIPNTCWNGGSDADAWGTAVTVDRIASQALGLTSVQLVQNSNAQRIGQALGLLGFTKKRCRVAGQRSVNGRLVVWRRTWTNNDGIVIEPAPRLERDGEPTPF